MNPRKKVLVVDDEPDIGELLKYNLEQEGFEVLVLQQGERVLPTLEKEPIELVILDLMLPGISGMELCKQLKRSQKFENLPIIILSAKSSETDKIVGLEMGADDYMTKPFSPREAVARVKAVLRRSEDRERKESHSTPESIEFDGIKVDLSRHEVFVDSQMIKLTNTEFKILQCLMERPGHVFNRQQLIDFALGKDVSVVDRTIDVHITNLRKKLGARGAQIESIRGVGYRLKQTREA